MRRTVRKIFIYFAVFFFTAQSVWLLYLLGGGREPAVLMYHSVAEPFGERNGINISKESFEKQMRFLRDHKYRVLSLAELVALESEGKPVPPKAVVLTFDDGYKNNYTVVYPILKKYNFPATVFVVVNSLGKKKDIYGRRVEFMTPEMLKEMSDSGLVMPGAHAMDHFCLTDLEDENMLRSQILESKDGLEKTIGRPVRFFCYPFGRYDRHIQAYVKEAGYEAAVTTFPKKDVDARDRYAIRRIIVKEKDRDPFVFFVKTSGYYLRMRELNS